MATNSNDETLSPRHLELYSAFSGLPNRAAKIQALAILLLHKRRMQTVAKAQSLTDAMADVQSLMVGYDLSLEGIMLSLQAYTEAALHDLAIDCLLDTQQAEADIGYNLLIGGSLV